MGCTGRRHLLLIFLLCATRQLLSTDPYRDGQPKKNRLQTDVLETATWYNTTTIHQAKLILTTGTIQDEFFTKIQTVITQLQALSNNYFNKTVVSLQIALHSVKNFKQMLTNVTTNFESDDNVLEIPFSPLPTQFLQAQTYPILSNIKGAKEIKDDSTTKNFIAELETELTQMAQLVIDQVQLYNNIVEGHFPSNQINQIISPKINISVFETIAAKFITSGNFDNKLLSYYAFYGFSDPHQIEKISVAPFGPFTLKFPVFFRNSEGYIFTSNLPKSLATAVQVYSASEVNRILNSDPEKITDLIVRKGHVEKTPDPFFFSHKASIMFNNENSAIPYHFGKWEAYSPIIAKFTKKLLKIGKNTLKFFLQLNTDEENIVNFETDQFILEHLNKIFNFNLEYLFLLLLIPFFALVAASVVIGCKAAKKIKERKERKNREKADKRAINMIFRRKPDRT